MTTWLLFLLPPAQAAPRSMRGEHGWGTQAIKTKHTPGGWGAASAEGPGAPQPKLSLGGGTRGPTLGPGTRPGGSSGKR